MKKLIMSIVAILLIVSVTGCTTTKSTDQKGNTKTSFTVNETAIVNKTKLKINSIKKLTKECAYEYDGKCYSYNEPENDYFIIIDITIENTGDEEQSISSILQFELKDPDGEKQSQEYMLEAIKSSLDGSIMANDTLKGQIAFDVKDKEYYNLYYQDSLFDDNIKFKINKTDIK